MNLAELLNQSFATFRAHKMRIFLTMFGIVWGIASVILLVSFSYNTGAFQPYMGLPRHCLMAFPLFLPMAVWGKRPRVEALLLVGGFLGMAVLAFSYAAQIFWVP